MVRKYTTDEMQRIRYQEGTACTLPDELVKSSVFCDHPELERAQQAKKDRLAREVTKRAMRKELKASQRYLYAGRDVYIGGLQPEVAQTPHLLEEALLGAFGDVEQCKVFRKGIEVFAFATFSHEGSAQAALVEEGIWFAGRWCVINTARPEGAYHSYVRQWKRGGCDACGVGCGVQGRSGESTHCSASVAPSLPTRVVGEFGVSDHMCERQHSRSITDEDIRGALQRGQMQHCGGGRVEYAYQNTKVVTTAPADGSAMGITAFRDCGSVQSWLDGVPPVEGHRP